jgi:hypothetical protein
MWHMGHLVLNYTSAIGSKENMRCGWVGYWGRGAGKAGAINEKGYGWL